jgi:hypothetical protein
MNKYINVLNPDKVNKIIEDHKQNVIINPPRFRYTREAINQGKSLMNDIKYATNIKGMKAPEVDIEDEIQKYYD